MLIVTTMFTEIDAKMEIFTREEESIFKIILKFQKLKNTVIEIKNLYRGFNTAEQMISEGEDRALENIQIEIWRGKRIKLKKRTLYRGLNNGS